jgi:hypothetical protein
VAVRTRIAARLKLVEETRPIDADVVDILESPSRIGIERPIDVRLRNATDIRVVVGHQTHGVQRQLLVQCTDDDAAAFRPRLG